MLEPVPLELDHLVYGVPDLRRGVEEFATATGVRPVAGGRHAGRGSANYLVGLGPGRYLEIIGPDPDDPGFTGRRFFGLDDATRPGWLTWAVRTDDIAGAVAVARAAGYDPGDPQPMARRSATGDMISWQLTPDTMDADGGVVPFLIEWGATPHPSAGTLPQLTLAELTLSSPRADSVRMRLAALGVDQPVRHGEADAIAVSLRPAPANGA
jgi:hypothetical protein